MMLEIYIILFYSISHSKFPWSQIPHKEVCVFYRKTILFDNHIQFCEGGCSKKLVIFHQTGTKLFWKIKLQLINALSTNLSFSTLPSKIKQTILTKIFIHFFLLFKFFLNCASISLSHSQGKMQENQFLYQLPWQIFRILQ